MFVKETTVQLHVTREVVDLDWLPGQGECVHESVVQVPVLLLQFKCIIICHVQSNIYYILLFIEFKNCILVCVVVVVKGGGGRLRPVIEVLLLAFV